MKKLWKKHAPTFKPFLTRLGVQVRENSFRVIGLGMISFGIGMIFPPAGVIAGGFALLLIEWSVEEDGEE